MRRGTNRDGVSLIELIVAATLLITGTTIVGQLTVATGRVWQRTRHERLASEELSNQLGRIVSLSVDRRDEAIASLSPSPLVTEVLPDAELAASRVTDDDGERLELVLRWPDRPKGIRIVGWLDADGSTGNGEAEEASR